MSVAEKVKSEIIQPQKNNNGLLVANPVYKPFRYPWCYDAWLTQQRIHWLPEEVPLGFFGPVVGYKSFNFSHDYAIFCSFPLAKAAKAFL